MTTWSQIGVHLKRASLSPAPDRPTPRAVIHPRPPTLASARAQLTAPIFPTSIARARISAVVLLNVNGFYSSLREFINKCADCVPCARIFPVAPH